MTSLQDTITVTLRPADSLRPHSRNVNTHPDAQLDLLGDAMQEVGWTSPCICDEDGVILAGHARYLSAQRLWARGGTIANVPTGMIPVVVRAGLTEAQKRKYLLADNKLQTLAVVDIRQLRDEVEYLIDVGENLGSVGFGVAEVERILYDAEPILLGPPVPPAAPPAALAPAPETSTPPPVQGEGATPFRPTLNPIKGQSMVTDQGIARAAERLEERLKASSEQKMLDVMCPHCGKEFSVDHP